MSNQGSKADDPFASLDIAENGDANWGDDWEAAFQAEENMFFSEGTEPGSSPAAERQTRGTAGKDPLADSLARSLDEIPETATPATAPFARLANLAAGIRPLAAGAANRLLALPLSLRIPAFLLPVFLLLSLLFWPGKEQVVAPARQTGERAATAPNLTGSGESRGGPPEPVRRKWEFPSFLVPVETGSADQPVGFVHADITLIAVLAPGEAPPADRELAVREMIYQFYRNIPAAELRRFSLARGEMNRKLREWLQKEWPDAPIESIIFDRYTFS